MEVGLVVAFWFVSLALVMSPGQDWACAIAAGMHGKAIVPAVSGMLLAYCGITVIVASGAGAVVSDSSGARIALSLAGGVYLAKNGISSLVHPCRIEPEAEGPRTGGKWFRHGLSVSGMNPKALLLFLTLLPQFTATRAPWPVSLQIAVLGLVQVANCAVIYTIVGIGSGFIARRRPQASGGMSRVSGLAMVSVGLMLMTEAARSYAAWR